MCCNTGVTIELSFYTGKFHCLVLLSKEPLTVFRGSGTSLEEAKISGAQKAVE
jgi:hypothetical protein